MYGLVFEIVEEWVIEKQGRDVWHTIKKNAGCEVKDESFVRRSYYPDEELVDIIVAASELLNVAIPDILEAFGHYVIRHHFDNGYDDLLRCQGSTLRQWLSNLNAMHDHIQKTFPGEEFQAPIFWCEDCDHVEGSILLHYYSLRGVLLVPMVVGIVEELASFHFEVEVKMTQLALQDEDESTPYTTWRITAVDETQRWKLSPQDQAHDEIFSPVNFDNVKLPNKCPFTGRQLKSSPTSSEDNNADGSATQKVEHPPKGCPFAHKAQAATKTATESTTPTMNNDNALTIKATTKGCPFHHKDNNNTKEDFQQQVGLTLQKMREVFPFHVIVDRDFSIIQVGQSLPFVLQCDEKDFNGKHVKEFLQISRPVLGTSWDWKALQKLVDQHFFLVPTSTKHDTSEDNQCKHALHEKVSMKENVIKFKGSIITISKHYVMFALTPDARNVVDLNNMGLTMSDLPLVSCQRDTVFLGEYITQEVDKAHKLDKLSKKLTVEKNLSNTLLYNMLPKQVADNLRSGNTIEPKFHENVTLFFSDIEGFTSICDQVDPWEVIDMLNQLYGVMDHLASHFNLYKVETIGDAYMCCSGLPEPDEYHAENIANFAIAVSQCVKKIKSPVDGSPLNLRIGIHTGSCTAGVVGTLTPHYCLFGDMVNTTARHESTGKAGKIQCSSLLYGRLQHFSNFNRGNDSGEINPAEDESLSYYNFTPRGLVNMKGKGECYTYWLESGTEHNPDANPDSVEELSREVSSILASKKWKKRRYFRRSGALRDETMSDGGLTDSTYSTRKSAESDPSQQDEVDEMLPPPEKDNGESEVSNNEMCPYGISEEDRREVDELAKEMGEENHSSQNDSLSDCVEKFNISIADIQEIDDYIEMVEEQKCNETLPEDVKQPKQNNEWSSLRWSSSDCLSTEDFVMKVQELLFSRWTKCKTYGQENSLTSSVLDGSEELFKHQLFGFVHRMSSLYNEYGDSDTSSTNRFIYICHVVLCSDYLWEQVVASDTSSQDHNASNDPWNHFIILFAALIYDINPSNANSSRCAISILEDEFSELYDELVYSCPKFLLLIRKAIAGATSLITFESTREMKKQQKLSMKFDKAMSNDCTGNKQLLERTTAMMEVVLSLASVAHYTQEYEALFLEWNKDILLQRQPFNNDPSNDKTSKECWYKLNRRIFNDIVLPIINRIEEILPESSCRLREGVERNMKLWEQQGLDWSASQLSAVELTSPDTTETEEDDSEIEIDDDPILGQTVLCERLEELVAANVEILSRYLKKIVASQTNVPYKFENAVEKALTNRKWLRGNPVDHVKEVITMRQEHPDQQQQAGEETSSICSIEDAEDVELSSQIQSELEDYVTEIASGYKKNQFHSFEHASHVVKSTDMFLKRAELASIEMSRNSDSSCNDYVNWMSRDSVASFAMVLSALVHDVGHTGVPNGQLAKESPDVANKYAHRSIAEQRSVDAAWKLILKDRYSGLRKCLFKTSEDLERFRYLIVNCVMSTDIFDKASKELRNSRWQKAFPQADSDHDATTESPTECVHHKSTVVIEHVIQASDVAHTMQDWDLYRKWNENLFLEMYSAYVEGRSEKNPVDGWYKGELWFFDNWVIPLATKLKECGVTGVFSSEYLDHATQNRRKWEVKGEKICRSMLRRAQRQHGIGSRPSARSEKRLPSCMRKTQSLSPKGRKEKLTFMSMSNPSLTMSRPSKAERQLTSQMVSEVDRLARFRRVYEKKMEVACKTLVTVATKQDGAEALRSHNSIDRLHKYLRKQDWYRSHSNEGWSSDEEDDDDDDDERKTEFRKKVRWQLDQTCRDLQNTYLRGQGRYP